MPFPLVQIWLRYLSISTSVFWGNSHIYTPDPLTTINSFANALESTLRERFLKYTRHEFYKQGNKPRLIVAAVDVQEGSMKTFDSDQEDITAKKVVACCSIAPYMPAKEVNGNYYWDGGLMSNTPLGAVMNTLQKSEIDKEISSDRTRDETIPEYKFYLIDDHPRASSLPQDYIAVQERVLDILLTDKSDDDVNSSGWINNYIKLVRNLRQLD